MKRQNESTKTKRFLTTKELTLVSVFTVLIIIGAFIKIPVPVVPFTLQFLFTCLAGILLGRKLGTIAVAAYVFMGLIGLPVFAEGGSIAYVIKPSFGYLLGFIVGAYVSGIIVKGSEKPSFKRLLVASFANLAVVYAIGVSYYALICNAFGAFVGVDAIAFSSLIFYCLVLAIPGDIVLCIVASIVALKLWTVVKKDSSVVEVQPNYEQSSAQKEADAAFLSDLTQKIIGGHEITRDEALLLFDVDIKLLSDSANVIRKHFCGDKFDMCTIINAKSGKCSENCKYCAQSSHYDTECEIYDLLSSDEIVAAAKKVESQGVVRFSLVTSGRNLSDNEVEKVADIIENIKAETSVKVCGSFGLLNESQYKKLYDSGLTRIHNNLETSRNYFENMCTTHSFDDKIDAIKQAENTGMCICSGGIFGIGESNFDRIDLAFELKKLGVTSVPINFLIASKGTPYEDLKPLSPSMARQIVAVFRFILPTAFIRLAGGRKLLQDSGRACFCSGANACITGDLLTTTGCTVSSDIDIVQSLGYEIIGKEK